MTEWKGSWMCEGCRVIFARHPANWHYVGRRFDGEPCLGPAVRYDRRARPPEKQELAEALRDVLDAFWDMSPRTSDDERNAALKWARSLLRRYEKEKP